jgi:cyclopropane fatty-acyl-phospholipid synthase-like methyltransferase
MSQELFWNTRYQDVKDDYLFGTAPSHFLANRADLFKKGESAILLADGEGRNSVWLAEKGLDVTAIEISPVALEKAKKLAAERNVDIDFIQSDMLFHDWDEANCIAKFDWVIGVFIQFVGREGMAQQFQVMKDLTRPGGRVLLHGYTPQQLEYKTGGPSDINNLYTGELLIEAFSDWRIQELIEYDADICEGVGHNGRSALIGIVAQKVQ